VQGSLFVQFKNENKEKAHRLGFNPEDKHPVFQVTPPDENAESQFLLANALGELIWIPQDAILGVRPDFQPVTNETPRVSPRSRQNGSSRPPNPYDDRAPVREGGYPPRSDTYAPRL
jgi:hypothetical protein